MALLDIKTIKRITKERNNIHEEVEATYCTLNDYHGNKYFQIDTYGKNDRQYKGKISQSIQLNKEGAIELINILKREFDIN